MEIRRVFVLKVSERITVNTSLCNLVGIFCSWTRSCRLNELINKLECVVLRYFLTHGLIYVGFGAVKGMLGNIAVMLVWLGKTILFRDLLIKNLCLLFVNFENFSGSGSSIKIIKIWAGDLDLGWRNQLKDFFLTYLEYWGMESKLYQAL